MKGLNALMVFNWCISGMILESKKEPLFCHRNGPDGSHWQRSVWEAEGCPMPVFVNTFNPPICISMQFIKYAKF